MEYYRELFTAMACQNEVQLYAANPAQASHAIAAVIDEVRRIEAKYSRYRDDSVVARINQNAGSKAVPVDAETAGLLRHAAACFTLSKGLFDITSGVLRRAWDFKSGKPPEAKLVEELLPLVNWAQVEFNGDSIRLPQFGMQVDFGGIGKEYAVDRCAAILQREGIAHGVVNLGGDIRVLGPRPDGTPWPVYIVHPRKTDSIIATVQLSKGALATSGDYMRYFDYMGARYCHVLNPRTGHPATKWQSVTVVSAMCIDAGSISTISMLMEDRALQFVRDRQENALLVDQRSRLHGSGALEKIARLAREEAGTASA